MIGEGDKVVTYKTLQANHQGEFMGISATGKKVEVDVIDIIRVVDGKCVEHWSITNMMDFMTQIGVTDPPGLSHLGLMTFSFRSKSLMAFILQSKFFLRRLSMQNQELRI